MDLGSALLVLSTEKAKAETVYLQTVGMTCPVAIPWSILSVTEKEKLLGQQDGLQALHVDLHVKLEAGKETEAWELIRRNPGVLQRSEAVMRTLELWSARQLTSQGISAQTGIFAMHPDHLQAPHAQSNLRVLQKNYSALRTLIRTLAWPYWVGQILILPPGQSHNFRPVLPTLVIDNHQPLSDQQAAEQLAGLICRLAGNPTPLPSWVQHGLAGITSIYARGALPSPRRLLKTRQQAGTAAIEALMQGKSNNRELAQAMMGPLLHTDRRHLFSSFIDALRNGASSKQALSLAYSMNAQWFITHR